MNAVMHAYNSEKMSKRNVFSENWDLGEIGNLDLHCFVDCRL